MLHNMAAAITKQQRTKILSLRYKRTQADIARIVGVSQGCVSNVLSGTQEPDSNTRKYRPRAPRQSAGAEPATWGDVIEASKPAPSAPTTTALVEPAVPDVIPDDVTDLELVDKWIRAVGAAANKANADGNMNAFASLTAKLVSLLEHRRKVQPTPKDDPNENPDMIAVGDLVWARLKKKFNFVE